ncbi:hypothetical protein GALL_395360 [mine drainage metagenome]|uniref:Zinc-ribbon domain-containing protein n=1 Tax=mine drainage metagenome TaxID=410659 RepID=A0A1J5Q6D5_9ZZZZ
MALTKCRECGKEISTEATSCPHCGAPKPATAKAATSSAAMGCFSVIVLIAIIAFVVNSCTSTSGDGPAKGASSAAAAATGTSCKQDDLQCRGDQGVVAASVYCKDPIESLAAHDVKWTDGFLGLKFSRFRWTSTVGGGITFVGDKAEFQNGFGAYTPVVYECDMAPDLKSVIAVRIDREGRLPGD